MNKMIFGLIVATSTAASAADFSVLAGKTDKHSLDVVSVNIKTRVEGFTVGGTISHTESSTATIGANVGRSFKLGKLESTPYIGVAHVDANSNKVKNGPVSIIGLNLTYPITKRFGVTLDLSRQWDILDKTNFDDKIFTAGIRASF